MAAGATVEADAIISISYTFYYLYYQLTGLEGAARPFTAIIVVSTAAA